MTPAVDRRNRELVVKLLVIVVGMVGFAYAMVPMYRQICKATGITQTRIVAPVNTQVDASREVRVELLASTAGSLPWKFVALDREVRMHPGELVSVRYRVTNTLGRPVTAHASMSTAPMNAARWIAKQECFCFTNQTFQAGETRELPVVFRVLTDAPRDMDTIALSYTFFELPKE
ncbi:MAG TPA: cytochrome c oxidase assembly protein [Usitatibacter sp.]|jgi:cytochrome c oxidase assembly protein subunit 11|nr:cytochrome c oxidase assembly protein [Usitatibacter sp.]